MRKIGRFVFGLYLLAISAYSLPPLDLESPSTDGEKILDTQTYFDVNNILMFITNQGVLCADWTEVFDQNYGFYFPYSGNCNDCYSGQTVVYSAGLFLGGKVNGQIRVAVGAFFTPEYYQGPADENGVHLPDDPRFKVYKIRRDSSVWLDPAKPECARLDSANHFNDWTLWQDPLVVQDGAPLDSVGNPLLLGDETLWTVFNDGGPHYYSDYGGGTNPLGVEVHQTVWGYDVPGNEGNALYIKYKFYNKSPDVIDSFYISFWADPDLGGAADDYVGCDTAHDIFFCYNADNDDTDYEIPPAWGGRVVYGPMVPSPGDTAMFDSHLMPDYKNIGMSSFNKYINGTDPDVPVQTYGYMQGFDAVAQCPTCPYVDLNTGDTTTFPLAGDPISGIGWLDTNPADRRLMANMGPVTFYPGDSQCVVIKLGAAAGEDRLSSLYELLNTLAPGSAEPPVYLAIDSLQTFVSDYGLLASVYFTPEQLRWLSAWNRGYDYLFGGACYGYDYYGSLLNPYENPEMFPETEVRFSNTNRQYAYRYIRSGDYWFDYSDYYEVPFTVWDIENDRQLNVAFTESSSSETYDSTWGPGSAGFGREHLFVFNSDYSGADPNNSEIDYTAMNILYNANEMDILYGYLAALEEGHSLDELDEPQKLVFKEQSINENGPCDSLLFGDIEPGQSWMQKIDIHAYSPGLSKIELSLSNPDDFSLSSYVLDFHELLTETVKIFFNPQAEGTYEEYLYIEDAVTKSLLKEIKLVASAAYVFWGNVIHVSTSGDDVTGIGSESIPFATIQHAIDMSENGDTVLVHDGTYTGDGNRDISYDGRSIVVISENGPEMTIIDCQGSEAEPHRGFYFHNEEDENTILTGFSIINGFGDTGGGIRLDHYVTPYITNCIFENNKTTGPGGAVSVDYASNLDMADCVFIGDSASSGGAVYYNDATGSITGCTFTGNISGHGGALRLHFSHPDIADCIFENNQSLGNGGAIGGMMGSSGIMNCEFKGNTAASSGGAAWFFESHINASNCLFVENEADKGGAIFWQMPDHGTGAKIDSSTFYGNIAYDSGAVLFSAVFDPGPPDEETSLDFENCIMAFNGGSNPIDIRDTLGIPQISCSDIYGNDAGDWVGCIADQAGINDNISADPYFCSPEDGYLYIAENSPCATDNSPCGELIGAYGVGCGTTEMSIEPDMMYAIWAYALDSIPAEILMPVTDDGYSTYDIDTSTVRINGTIVPLSQEFISSDPFGEYLQITILISEFVDGYNPLWDTTMQTYTVSWEYNDATAGEAAGQVKMIGHISGDVNGDGVVNILDVTYLIYYMYKGGPPPVPMERAGDVNGDEQLNILDMTYLVIYLYKGGPPPIPPGL